MAVAAAVAGEEAEARFWRGLPATLAALREQLPAHSLKQSAQLSSVAEGVGRLRVSTNGDEPPPGKDDGVEEEVCE